MMYQRFFAFLVVFAFGLTSGAAIGRAQTPSAPPVAAPEEKDPSFLRVLRHEEVKSPRLPVRTLHTWYMESRGAGVIEARVWYIAEGRATLRAQRLLEWDKRMPTELWRLQMLEQAAPNSTLLPSYELTTLFDNPLGKPTSTVDGLTGFANSDAHRTERLPAAFNAVFTADASNARNASNAGGIAANRPFLFYAAQPRPPFGDQATTRILRGDDPNAIETLTKQSRTPGRAFLVLAVRWTPSQDKPKPSD